MFSWLQTLADWITYTMLSLPNESAKHTADMSTMGRVGSAVDFFILDSIKIYWHSGLWNSIYRIFV